jgi:hypothetical protein
LSPGRVKNFHLSISSRPALGPTQPLIPWVPGAYSPGIERPGREADHSSPASAVFMAYCLIWTKIVIPVQAVEALRVARG